MAMECNWSELHIDLLVLRDWSQLPIEILELIAESVVSISDFIRFQSICKSWRRAAIPSKLRPQPPILYLPYNIFNPDRYFFSLATTQTHHISLPHLVGKEIFASSNGWMLLFDVQTETLSLHNPISLASIQLPPVNNLEQTIDSGQLLYDRFTDSFVVLIHHDDCLDARSWFCKVGDESWSVPQDNNNFRDSICRIIYHKGKFFTLKGRDIYIDDDVNAASSAQSVPVGSIQDILDNDIWMAFDSHLVTADGELFLLVFGYTVEYEGYLLYKLQYSEGEWIKWPKSNFKDFALFISNKDPTMFRVDDFPQYKEKIAYSAGFDEEDVEQGLSMVHCEDDSMDVMFCGWDRPDDFGHGTMWFTPSFR